MGLRPPDVQRLLVRPAVTGSVDVAGGGPAAEGGGDAPWADLAAQLPSPALLDLFRDRVGPEQLVRRLVFHDAGDQAGGGHFSCVSMCVAMTHKEFEQRKRRLDEQLEAGIAMLREGHRAQIRALERRAGGEPAAAEVLRQDAEAPARGARRTRVYRPQGEVYEEVAAVLSQLPAEFDKNDVLRALGRPAGRASLFRALRKLEDEGRIEVQSFGSGRVAAIYRRKQKDAPAEYD